MLSKHYLLYFLMFGKKRKKLKAITITLTLNYIECCQSKSNSYHLVKKPLPVLFFSTFE